MRFVKETVISPRWQRFIDYIETKGIKAGVGVIGESFEEGNEDFYTLLQDIDKRGHIEFWNHGFDHHSNYTDENRTYTYYEFKNKPYEEQYEHLVKTQNLCREKTGIILHTFGAPHNKTDEHTLAALEKIDAIKVWLYGNPAFSRLNLRRTIGTEFPTHNPDFQKFVENYQPDAAYHVLQVHPNSWGDERFEQFENIIDFLLTNGVTFINPYEYYRIVRDGKK